MVERDTRRIQRNLLIDADDTLWENNVFYLKCTQGFLGYLESLALDASIAQDILDQCERELIPIHGYSPHGYMTALGMCCRRLAEASGLALPEEAIERARSFGEPLLDSPIILRAGVEHALRGLYPTSRLVLVTKGDERYQSAKIERSGLRDLFDAQYILREKDEGAYRRIVTELRLDPHATWMVGNSPRSDINPAVRAGLGAIYIPHESTWTAEMEPLEQPELVVTLRSIVELLDFFGVDGEG